MGLTKQMTHDNLDYPEYSKERGIWIIREWLRPESRGYLVHDFDCGHKAMTFYKKWMGEPATLSGFYGVKA